MNLHVIHTGYFKLDGGAMFGVVPKTLWQNKIPADSNNRCTWSLRCLLIEDGNRLILIDNGMGNKQSEKFRSIFEPHGTVEIQEAIRNAGFRPEEVTDNILTHLHFDHCGGSVYYRDGNPNEPRTSFTHATYWSNQQHWDWATQANLKEKASFLPENLQPILDSGQLEMIDLANPNFHPDIEFMVVDGHTEKQMLPRITYKDHTIVFVADLLPSTAHVPLPYVMGYDIRPLVTIEEKHQLLEEAATHNYILYFEHDPEIECATVKRSEKGIVLDACFPLSELG
jgi:glyoxylase-like metal-dependent hydrolase (beta-lactamase superfamily II)